MIVLTSLRLTDHHIFQPSWILLLLFPLHTVGLYLYGGFRLNRLSHCTVVSCIVPTSPCMLPLTHERAGFIDSLRFALIFYHRTHRNHPLPTITVS